MSDNPRGVDAQENDVQDGSNDESVVSSRTTTSNMVE